MKRIFLTAVALSLFIAPNAFAAERSSQPQAQYQTIAGPHWNDNRHDRRVVVKKRVIVKHHWNRGGRISAADRRHVVGDYHRFGLRAPARGQQWVQVDNDYLLIGITSGIIAGIIAGH